MYIYYTYNKGLDASLDADLHPFKEWTQESYILMGTNFTYGFFWLMNLILDHNAGFLDRITLILSNLMILAPFAAIAGVFIASSAYGSAAEVALGTDWALTIEDDSDYSLIFNLTALLAILNFSWAFMSRGSLSESYN